MECPADLFPGLEMKLCKKKSKHLMLLCGQDWSFIYCIYFTDTLLFSAMETLSG